MDGGLTSCKSNVLLLTTVLIPKRFDLLVDPNPLESDSAYLSTPFFFIWASAAATLGGEGGDSFMFFRSFLRSSLTTSPIVWLDASAGKPYIPVIVPNLTISTESVPANIWLWCVSTFSGSPVRIHSCYSASSGVIRDKGLQSKHRCMKSKKRESVHLFRICYRVFEFGFRFLPRELATIIGVLSLESKKRLLRVDSFIRVGSGTSKTYIM